MTNTTPAQPDSDSGHREQYTHGYGVAPRVHAGRTASTHAAFFLKHLTPGMRLLDCGCGPGSITVGLAEINARGETVGIDLGESLIEAAGEAASRSGDSSVRFEVADIYEIPFSDSSFDAVFSHALLEHLNDAPKALAEMHRVLRPGGVIGVRTPDRGSDIFWPEDEVHRRFESLWTRLWQRNGGDPFIGRRLRHLLLDAGFVGVEASASYDCYGTREATQHWGSGLQTYTRDDVGPQIIELGWADQSDLDSMVAAWGEWANLPDAFWAISWCEAVGWKG